MGITKTEKWECDLCRQANAMGTGLCPPDGWLKVTLESQFMGFFDKCICGECIKAIRLALEREKLREGK